MIFSYAKLFIVSLFCISSLSGCFESISYTENGMYWGVLGKDIAQSNTLYNRAKSQAEFGPHIKGVRLDWDQEFPSDWVNEIYETRILPLIVWDPWIWQEKESLNFKQIIAGDFDDYLDRWASAIYKVKLPVLIDIFSTPESEKYPWHVASKADADALVSALTYIQNRFKEKGANNVIWFTYSNSETVRVLLSEASVQPFNLMQLIDARQTNAPISEESKIILFTDTVTIDIKDPRFNPDVEKFQSILKI